MSADRNLLFGMLALHNGFVSREQLLEAMTAWMLRKETPLGVILREQGALADDDLRMLDGLVERQVHRYGDARKSLASLGVDPKARHDLEQLADAEVQASLASVGPAEHTTANSVVSAVVAGAECPGGPSRYRKLRPHAKGGLGEVFVALDEELKREVALKEIQDRFAEDADSRRRFIREAEITGNLEHPGVVPVYGLLREDGRPIYAMRFIKGETLHDAIARFHAADKRGRDPGERSLALRGLLGRFVAMCNAVAYAHSRGVIHRDLKPANVMLGEYGETIVVDWGLARVLVQTDPEQTTPYSLVRLEDGDTGTQLGKALGTPAFMPPEQARGEHDRVGIASDVFALGATLYALLTSKAPFRDLEKAKQCEFPEPRQVNAKVPRALAAVCQKAMAARTEERYATARELAEEVEHCLADEPVKAYREPLRERVRRWGRRHRTLVSSGVVLLVTGVVALSVGLWAVRREKAATETALERAESNLDLAKKAVDAFFVLGKEHPEIQKPQMRKVRRLILENVLPFYQDFQVQRPDDVGIQRGLAEQHFRVAYILDEIGRKKEGLTAYEQACEIFGRLAKDHPEVPQYQRDLAATHNNLGILLRGLGKPEEAREEYEQARAIRARLAKDHPEVPEVQKDLAGTHNNLGILLKDLGKPEEARKEYEQARTIRARLVKDHPEVPEFQNDLAATHNNLGILLIGLGKREEARKEFEQARTLRARLTKDHPEVPEFQKDLAGTHNNLGILLIGLGKREEARKEFEQARTLRARLAKDHPEVPEFQNDLAATHNNLGILLRGLGKPEEARKEYEQARAIQARLAKDHPEVPEVQKDLAGTHNNLGILLRDLGKPEEARKEYEQARTIRARLVKDHPEVPEYKADLGATHLNLSRLQRQMTKPHDALKSVEQAIPLLQAARQHVPQDPTYRLHLRMAHVLRADLLGDLNRHRDAIAHWDEVLRLESDPAARDGFRLQRADALTRAGDYRRAMTESDDLSRGTELAGGTLYNVACVVALSAAACVRDGGRPLPEREKQAEKWSHQAVELIQRAATAGYFRDPANRAHLDKDADLAFLRHRDDYAAFVKTLPPVAAPGSGDRRR